MKITLTKALKRKKKLLAEIAKYFERFSNNNSHEVSTKTNYDAKENYELWLAKTQELINLKTAIQIANAPIYPKIFEMAEHKAMIDKLRYVNTKSGQHKIPGGYNQPNETVEYNAFLDVVSKDKLVEELEDKIENLQAEIEAFNAVTNIEV